MGATARTGISSVRPTIPGVDSPRRVNTRSKPTHRAVKPANRNTSPSSGAFRLVPRVGGAAQIKAMKQVAGTLRIDLAQFRELAAFAQFGSDLDKSTQNQLERGRRLTEVLKQGQYQPMPVEQQVLIIWTVSNGLADDIEVSELKRFEEGLFAFIENSHPAVLQTMRDKKSIDDDLKNAMKEAVEDFKATRWSESKTAIAKA